MGTRKSGAGALLFCFLVILLQCGAANDNLTQSQALCVEQTLVSPSGIFELGFFSLGNSSNRFVGIWYRNISVHRYVWVANRENPLSVMDTGSSLIIGSDGNLKIVDGNQSIVWSTTVSTQHQLNSTTAVLSDNGNFRLRDTVSGTILWESFAHVCDTFLPGMMLGTNNGGGPIMTSWQTEDNPSPGKFISALSSENPPQSFTWNGLNPYWRSGPWNGIKFVGIVDSGERYLSGEPITSNQQGSKYFQIYNSSYVTMETLTPQGSLTFVTWYETENDWKIMWDSINSTCDVYGTCGPFGVCNKNNYPVCECMKGFVPKSSEEWSQGNWTNGCVRRTDLLCQRKLNGSALVSDQNDWFQQLGNMKLPDHFESLVDIRALPSCEQWCLNNCTCVAYAFPTGIGCMVWFSVLVDVQQFSIQGEDLFLRLASSELRESKREIILIVSLTSCGIVLLCICIYVLFRWKGFPKESRRKRIFNFATGTEDEQRGGFTEQESADLPTFDFNTVVLATDNFSQANKLGEGGFGSVYKGKLDDGKQVAVKRLSSHSGQGIIEFKNEIILISKLQHRNLVRLLGYCIRADEKIVIYEYMANKSLDFILFDLTKKLQLTWAKRFNIILGIARGLLYLHRDSSLRVIHRDLKASNILLDDNMNPKISDFGLARTFQRTQEVVNTHRIVGTFGYMPPEYVVRGVFSEKSDVFSFGVLLLEIVSGMRNNSFSHNQQYLSLLGYAWNLWEESRALDLMDQTLGDSSSSTLEIMRCIQVGLLCVQDHALDRPTMSAVINMLTSEAPIPRPTHPGFISQGWLENDPRSHFQGGYICSINSISVSTAEGR